ncbi:MAG: carbohydrate kinase family protein [Candidatus Magasanikbacteria bacterium]|nr:carbohydrate kinase family protein [Candidatus Magasanikbacteria bacterium]
MFNLITIGDALIDTHVFIDNATLECDLNQENCQLCLNFATKIPITHSFQALGGNAANVAVGTANLGLKTAILTTIGDDASGKMVKEELKKQKVHTNLVSVDKQTPTRYSVVLNFKKERTILSYHEKREYDFHEDLPQIDWVYYTSLSEGYETLQEKMLDFLNKHKQIHLAYNPGSLQLKNIPLVKQVIARTDMLILNVEEAEAILNTKFNPAKIRACIDGLLNLGAKEVALTDSAKGAWAGNKDKVWHCESFPVEVLSKTGAGDAFSAAYLAARFYKEDIDTALLWGIANSSHVISIASSDKIPLNKKEMAKTISQFSPIKPTEIN